MAIKNLVTHGLLGPVGFLVTHGLGAYAAAGASANYGITDGNGYGTSGMSTYTGIVHVRVGGIGGGGPDGGGIENTPQDAP